MNPNTLVKTLQNIGLTEKESKVYLANLEIGTKVVSEIAKKAKINRVTTYDILQKLVEKTLVSQFTKNKLKYFTASDPEEIITDYKNKLNNLENSLPELRRLKGETKHPKIRYFEGIEGIKKIYADTLSSKTEILNFANSAEIRKHWPEYDEEYVQKRCNKKIYLRGIAPLDKQGEKVRSENKKYNRDIRLIPGEQYTFSNEINIYDDKVAIISFKDELIGTIIESPAIAKTQHAIFNMAWEFANQFGKNQPLGSKSNKKQNKKPKTTKTQKEEPTDPPPLEDQVSMF